MEHYQEYLATEVALDHVGGHLTRREALRQLGMMGLSTMAATSLLAACASDDGNDDPVAAGQQPSTTASASSASSASSSTTSPPASTPVSAQAITYPGPAGPIMGAFAPAAGAKGAVLVIHQNRGLQDDIKAIATRLAGDGYSALAVDLLSAEGGTAAVPADQLGAKLTARGTAALVGDMRASLDELVKRQPGAKLGLIGFCFGGTMAWSLLAEGEPRLAAAVPFYGTVPADVDFAKSKAAVLGVYGETDGRVNATRETASLALEKAKLTKEIRTFPGVGHGFYSDIGSEQSKAAYQAVLDWYGRYLK